MAALDVGELVQQREAAEGAATAAAARGLQLQQELAQVHTASSFPWLHSVPNGLGCGASGGLLGVLG